MRFCRDHYWCSGVLAALGSLSSDRSSSMQAEGAVTLVFNGYEDDPRELEAIPFPDLKIKQACVSNG